MSARRASGSRDSPSAVDPVTSANSTVTSLRTSRAGAERSGWRAPHSGQNFVPAATSAPHSEHVRTMARSVGAGAGALHGGGAARWTSVHAGPDVRPIALATGVGVSTHRL